jgi:hypothetical protein
MSSQTTILTVELRFVGQIVTASFIAFARHRAARLDLGLDFGDCGPASITLRLQGEAALVDMFEMACSLGPQDCIIGEVFRDKARPGATRLG